MKVTKKLVNEAAKILLENGIQKETIELMKTGALTEIDKLNKIKKEENEVKKRKKYGKLIVCKYLNEKKPEDISFEENGAIRFFDKNQNRFRVCIISKTSILVEKVESGFLTCNQKTYDLSKELVKILEKTNY